jgi:hypothetical protein
MMHTSADGRTRFTFEAYGRWDFENEYGVVDLPEANFFYDGGTWSVLAGMHKEFWGVAESRHLVNIINPIDLDGDPVYEDTFGIPMLNYNVTGSAGTLSLYGIVGFRDLNFKGMFDRYPIDEIIGSPEYEDGDWRNAAFAARYSNTVNLPGSSLDYALSFFTGTDRYAELVPNTDFNWEQYRGKEPEEIDYKNGDKDLLTPVYYHIDQVGAELLYAIGAWQFKFEGIYRRENDENIYAGVGGFEYTLGDVFGTNYDLGLIGEYLYDSRKNVFRADYPTSNAVFGGVRLTLNNIYNTNLIAGVSYDVDDESNFVTFSGSSRLTETTQVNLEGRFFQNFPKEDGSFLLNSEDYIELSLTKFF